MKDSMPESAPPNMWSNMGPNMGHMGPNMGHMGQNMGPNMYGGGHHHHQMPPHSMPTPPPPPSMNQHHQTSQDMSEHVHSNNYQQQHSFQDEGGMANMDLEEQEPYQEPEPYTNHKPMQDVYHTARRQHSSSPHPPGQYLPKHIHEQNKQRRFYPQQNQMAPSSWNSHPGEFNHTGNSSNQHDMPLDDPNAALDAAARKKLPIWLRQGLEKMENEKQKKEQDQIRAKLREEKLRKKKK